MATIAEMLERYAKRPARPRDSAPLIASHLMAALDDLAISLE